MFRFNLYPHQLDALKFIERAPYQILNLQMGLGKSFIALAHAHKYKLRTLVVVPAYLKHNWKAEIEKFLIGEHRIHIVSYSSLKNMPLSKYDYIVADECQFLKNKDAKRTIAFHELVAKTKPKYLSLLSGTPIKNRVNEFWSLLQLCYYGGSYPSFFPFYNLYYKFCHSFSYERTFEVNGIPIVRFDGVKNPQKLVELVRPIHIRMKSEDVIDLPDSIEKQIVDSKKHDKALKECFELFEKDATDPQYMTLKRATALAKVSKTVTLAKDLNDTDNKCLIFTCHQESAKELAKKMKCKYIDGTVDVDKRQEIVDNFNKAEKGNLVMTIGAGSTGYNITGANHTIFNDYPFVPADIDQAKARTRRIGQNKTCFYYYILSSEFDKKLLDMIRRKERDIGRIYK